MMRFSVVGLSGPPQEVWLGAGARVVAGRVCRRLRLQACGEVGVPGERALHAAVTCRLSRGAIKLFRVEEFAVEELCSGGSVGVPGCKWSGLRALGTQLRAFW